MVVTTTIGSTPVSLLNGTPPSLHDTLDQRSTIRLVVIDKTGTLHFQPMQPVTITDSYAGRLFTGYVNDATETNLSPQTAITHTVTCFDQHWLADKRVASGASDDDAMSNQYAGDNVVYLLANYLEAEGVTASYAQRRESTLTDFQAGTLTNVVATDNVGDGDLELSTQGTPASTTFGSGFRDFVTGATLSSVDCAASGQPFSQLNLKAYSALKYSGTNGSSSAGNLGNTYAYWEVCNDGATVIASGDTLQYDVWISSTSPLIQGAVDFTTTDGIGLRDFPNNTQAMHDQNFIKAHPGTDLSGYANDQWYHRTIDLTLMAGKTISHVDLAFEGDTGGTYLAYFRNIFVYNNSGGVKKTVFDSSQHAYSPQQQSISGNYLTTDNGYTNLSVMFVTVYDQVGTWISPALSIDAAKLVRASLLSWTTSMAATTTAASLASGMASPNVPAGTTLTLYTSIDNKATWQAATFESPIPNLSGGFNVTNRSMYVKAVFAIANPSPELSPILTALQATVSSSWSQVKTDSITTAGVQGDFNTGNYTNTAWYSDPGGANTNLFPSTDVGVTLSGYWTGWDRPDGTIGNVTIYTALATTNVYTWYRQLNIYAISGGDIRVKLNNAPNLQNFTAQLSVAVREDVSRENGVGFVYRTTNWANANETWAYTVMLEFNAGMGSTFSATPFVHVQLGRANNAGTTTGTYVSIADVLLPFVPKINTVYTLKVVVNGNSHKVYVDDVLWINATDSTWTASGGFGIRYYNASGNGYTGIYDNFGVVQSLSGQWDNGSGIVLGSGIGTVGNSLVAWDADVPSGGTLSALTSVDGGATWQSATSGSAIPNLAPGTNTVGKSVRIKFLLGANAPIVTPILKGWTIWLTKQTNAAGSRVSLGLDLSAAGRAGSTLVNWNGATPPGTNIFIDSAPDNTTWTNLGSGAQGNAQIAGIQSQLDPIDDTFDSNTSGFYVSTFQTNGTTATWDFSTAVPATSYISASGGTNAFLLYNSLVADDIDLVTDMGLSDAGGLVWRFVDSNNFYDLVIGDASSPTPNTATLCKVTNTVRATLATATLSWVRGVPHRICVLMLGGSMTVSFDGVQLLTYTDHFPLAVGQCGLRTSTVSGASAALFYHFRVTALGDSVEGLVAWTQVRLTSTDPTATPQLYDITTSVRSPNIGTGALIPSTTYSVLNGSTNTIATDVDDMAKQSNSWWKLRYDPLTGASASMFFQSHTAQLAPFLITGADILLSNSPVTVNRSGSLYRNTPWILGGTDTSLVAPETFRTDGFRRTFTLQHPVSSLVDITDGTKDYTFGVAGIDVGRDFYYTVGSYDVPQDASALTLAPGLQLTFTYNGQTNVVATVSNASEIAAQAQIEGSGTGIVEVAETAQGLTSAAAAALAASRETMYTAKPTTINFTTPRGGLAVGQLTSVFLPQHALVDFECLITDIVVTWRKDNGIPDRGFIDATPYFTITASSGYLMNSWQTTLAGLGR